MVCVVTVVVVVLEDIAGAVDWLDRKKDIPELRMDSLAQDWHSRDWYSRDSQEWERDRLVGSVFCIYQHFCSPSSLPFSPLTLYMVLSLSFFPLCFVRHLSPIPSSSHLLVCWREKQRLSFKPNLT